MLENEVRAYESLKIISQNSILERLRIKWTKNEFLMVVLVKYIILNKIKIWVQRPLKKP